MEGGSSKPLGPPLDPSLTKYFPHLNLLNTLHKVCFMHGLSIYETKKICHHAQFFIISYGRGSGWGIMISE